MSRYLLIVTVLLSMLLTGCGGVNLLVGRQPCWPEADKRLAGVTRGQLFLDLASGTGTLSTPDGTDFPTRFPFMSVESVGPTVVLTDEGKTIALSGETLNVFGGLGLDGTILVCSIEEESD